MSVFGQALKWMLRYFNGYIETLTLWTWMKSQKINKVSRTPVEGSTLHLRANRTDHTCSSGRCTQILDLNVPLTLKIHYK